MKNRKLLVRVSCTKRNFYLARPKGRNDWHIIFTPPRWARVSLGKGRVCRSTGTSEIEAAKRIAAQIIESFWKDGGASAEASGLLATSGMATIGELLAIYEERATEERKGDNANSMRRMIRTVHEGDANSKPVSILTENLVEEFDRRYSAAGRTSAASCLRQARSVVALPKMKFYRGLSLPDLTGFRAVKIRGPELDDLEPLDMNMMRAMDAATPGLAESDPAVYVAHLLFAYLGMRNKEILHARESWIVGGRIGIIKRPEENFRPKGKSGWIPIDAAVLKEIDRFKDLRVDGYLVPGGNLTERHNAIYRRHSKWVSTWIFGHRKTSYELRRYAGSRLLDMGATIFEVRDFLRHSDVQTTQRWYAYRLQNRELPTIPLGGLVPETVSV